MHACMLSYPGAEVATCLRLREEVFGMQSSPDFSPGWESSAAHGLLGEQQRRLHSLGAFARHQKRNYPKT